MSQTVLKIDNLSKLYRLGEIGTGTISHDINRMWARLRGKEDPYALVGQINDRSQQSQSDYVWALKDINFEIKQGEVVGIIGRNGAGKSTLLKILSQITSPTTGTVKTKGRIASLLEVGTGMHPEMSARENIFLNGAILGMSKREIASKFDEIIDFSGCAMYVDTPIKRFSSGMRVRLGFAVAAFLEPEILIVDEVLAVGDAEFQKKAIGKMKDISNKGGRTVLFVSHNMASVMQLCSKGILMKNGSIDSIGPINQIISSYLNAERAEEETKDLFTIKTRNGNGKIQFQHIEMLDEHNSPITSALSGQTIKFKIKLRIHEPANYPQIHISMKFVDDNDVCLFHMCNSTILGKEISATADQKELTVVFTIPKLPLNAGTYSYHLYSSDIRKVFDEISFAGSVKVEPGNFFSSGKLPSPNVTSMLVDATFETL